MREIKFRAWDKLEMVYFDLGGRIYAECPILSDIDKDSILMQYTGLKDKNGNEIFEGDIVKFSVNYVSKPICKDTVAWCDRRLCWEVKSRGHLLCSEHNIEIIGNIYENPELLEVKK